MKVITRVDFSGVKKGTGGIAVRDDIDGKIEWKVTWDLDRIKNLVDWFDESEFEQYLEKV